MKLFSTSIGRLRILAMAEGVSLLLLCFIAVPLKYGFHYEKLTSIVGAIHGCFFVLFTFSTLKVSIEENWKFKHTTWKILLACLIPFGTFYVDSKILKTLYTEVRH